MGDKHSFPFPRDFRPHGTLPLWKVSQGSTLIHVTPSTQHLQETQYRALYSMQPLVACKLICVEPRKSLVVQIPDLCAQLVTVRKDLKIQHGFEYQEWLAQLRKVPNR